MDQIDRSPVLVFCHTMSALPSPLKSPAPAIDHTVGTWGRAIYLPPQEVPLISQIERSPVLVFCQSICVAGAVTAEALALENGATADQPALNDPAGGLLTLIPPATGPYMLMWSVDGTASVLFFAAGAVGGESLHAKPAINTKPVRATRSPATNRVNGRLPERARNVGRAIWYLERSRLWEYALADTSSRPKNVGRGQHCD